MSLVFHAVLLRSCFFRWNVYVMIPELGKNLCGVHLLLSELASAVMALQGNIRHFHGPA